MSQPTSIELAKATYAAYGATTGNKNYQGLPMPAWEDLPDQIQQAWVAASTTAANDSVVPDAAKRTIRTILQTAVGVAVALPAIVAASGIPEALPWVAVALAVAGGFARVMALPGVQTLLPSWLRVEVPKR